MTSKKEAKNHPKTCPKCLKKMHRKTLQKSMIEIWSCGRVFCRSPARICCYLHSLLHFLTSPKSRLLGPKIVLEMALEMGAKERSQGTQNGSQNDPKGVEKKSCERGETGQAGASRGRTKVGSPLRRTNLPRTRPIQNPGPGPGPEPRT